MATEDDIPQASNDHLVLICGASSTGKSASLMGLNDPDLNPGGVMYLNTEANKRLPFKANFMQDEEDNVGFNITNPYEVPDAFGYAKDLPKSDCHTIAVDSLTFLLDQYETQYIANQADGRKAWGEFAQYFKKLMQSDVASCGKTVFFLAHTLTQYNESDQVMETKVPVKGSLKNNGIEAYFSTVVYTKKMSLKKLEKYESKYLNITEEDKLLKFKYVFQTKPTAETSNERMRGPMGMWSIKETFIDNNAQFLKDKLVEYYGK